MASIHFIRGDCTANRRGKLKNMQTIARHSIGIAIAVLMCTNLHGQTSTFKAPPPRFSDPQRRVKLASAFPEIDAAFREFAARNHVPGAAWGIVVDGELAHFGTAGVRDMGSKAPVERDTAFRIASMTKSFTAMSILKLRDEGKLSLDDPAERYVPELKALLYPTADSPRITIRHLLSHSEGFPEDNPWGDRQLADTDEQLSQMLAGGIPFSHTPGLAYEYSNYGFAILGRIVANVSDPSGTPRSTAYERYVTENILKPLGMTSTTLEPSSVPSSRLALGYRWEDDRWKEEPILPHGAFGSMGGMTTTIPDLARYVSVFLGAWPPRDDAEAGPIRRSSLREMQQIWRPSGASVSRDATGAPQLASGGYAFGLRVSQNCAFNYMVAHGGGLPGYGSQMLWLPDYGVGVIAFGNLRYTPWGGTVNIALAALTRTGGLEPRAIQPSPALTAAREAAEKLVIRWDDVAADSIAAENLFLDRDKPHRRADMDDLHKRVGACRAHGRFDHVENALRGDWTMDCDKGKVSVAITLAPTMPPKVQFLSATVAAAAAPSTGSCSR
jgi:CubicO group peptidase (beta-lactamase class C family)